MLTGVWTQHSDELNLPHFIAADTSSFQWMWTTAYLEGYVWLKQSSTLLQCFSLCGKHGGGFLGKILFARFWLAEAALVIGSQEPSTHSTQAVQRDSLSCSNMEVACHLADLQAAVNTTCIWYPRFHVFPVGTKAKQIKQQSQSALPSQNASLPSEAKMQLPEKLCG